MLNLRSDQLHCIVTVNKMYARKFIGYVDKCIHARNRLS